MPIGKKKSPAKFIGAVSAGLGILKGVTSIIGAQQEKKRLREENQIAKGNYQQTRRDIQDLEITNPYKDLNTSFENTFEDMTVNQQQAQFQAQQGAQARANLLSNLQGAAGGSGIAGLAQAMANQQQTQTQQISANIGQQEAANQRASAQGAMNVQNMTQQAQQTVARGEGIRRAGENQRQMNLLDLRSGRQQAQADFRGQIQAQKNAVMGGIGDIVGAGLGGFAAGGGFSKGGFKMNSFLGKAPKIDFSKAIVSGSGLDLTNSQYQSSAGSDGFGTAMRRNSQTGLMEEVEFADRFN